MGDCDELVDDDVAAFRAAAIRWLGKQRPLALDALEDEHALLARRLEEVA